VRVRNPLFFKGLRARNFLRGISQITPELPLMGVFIELMAIFPGVRNNAPIDEFQGKKIPLREQSLRG
jgi:hypothetical protein